MNHHISRIWNLGSFWELALDVEITCENSNITRMGQWRTTERGATKAFLLILKWSKNCKRTRKHLYGPLWNWNSCTFQSLFVPACPHPELISQRRETTGIENVRMLVFLIPAMVIQMNPNERAQAELGFRLLSPWKSCWMKTLKHVFGFPL